jgi:ABC-type Fe3+ transport system substrate-binding protein
MATILLHCPLNISRTIDDMMKKYCSQFGARHGIDVDIMTQPHRPDEKSLFESCLDHGAIPDMTVGHVNDFAELPPDFLEEHFLSIPGRFPIRKTLSDSGFADDTGFFHPFVIIPFAIFYNRNLINEKNTPQYWKDLRDIRWRGKIRMPDSFRVVSKVVRSFMKTDFPDADADFEKNVIHQGSPMEVVSAVDEGDFPIGITNIAFARISRHQNTRVLWPLDGLYCMPQVMVWRRGAPEVLLEIGDYLMSHDVQEYLSLQSFVPAAPEVPLHHLISENNSNLRWKGWSSFLEAVKDKKDKLHVVR